MAFDEAKVRGIADRVASSSGLEVVDIEFRGGGNSRMLRVFIDKPAGVTHEDCANFSREFGTILDVEDAVPGASYVLEVSSPGLDRKLTRPGDFERFAGSLIKLQTFEPVAGNRHWQGRLTQVNDQALTLDLSALKQKGKSRKAAAKANQEHVEIALRNIEKANLIPEF